MTRQQPATIEQRNQPPRQSAWKRQSRSANQPQRRGGNENQVRETTRNSGTKTKIKFGKPPATAGQKTKIKIWESPATAGQSNKLTPDTRKLWRISQIAKKELKMGFLKSFKWGENLPIDNNQNSWKTLQNPYAKIKKAEIRKELTNWNLRRVPKF